MYPYQSEIGGGGMCDEHVKKSIIASALTARAWDYPLAQSVERWTPLPEAPGSIPGAGT